MARQSAFAKDATKPTPMISPTQRAMDWEFYLFTMKQLQGNVLTVIDASITGVQNKAIKDLLRGYFYDRISASRSFFFDGVALNETWPEFSLDVE